MGEEKTEESSHFCHTQRNHDGQGSLLWRLKAVRILGHAVRRVRSISLCFLSHCGPRFFALALDMQRRKEGMRKHAEGEMTVPSLPGTYLILI